MQNILRTAMQFWKETWDTNKPLFIAEMLGTLNGMGAAAMIGWQSPTPDLVTIFILYNLSAFCFLYSNYIRHSAWMMMLMIFYVITNTIGLIQAYV